VVAFRKWSFGLKVCSAIQSIRLGELKNCEDRDLK
jgi:hypothetical protein